MSSSTIDLNAISLGLVILEKFLDAKSERTKGIDFKNLKLFENALKQIETLLSGPHFLRKDEKNFPVYKFMNELFKSDGLRFIQAIEHAKKANLLPRIYSFYRSPAYYKVSTDENEAKPKKGLQSFLSRKNNQEKVVQPEVEPEKQGPFPLFAIADFLISLGSAGENFQVIVDVISNPRNTILIGGTMRPTDLVTSLLTKDCGIDKKRIIDNSYDHIIDATNLRIVSIGNDPSGPLTFTHTSLKDKTIFTRLLDSLHPFIKSVSNGLAVFFPSKAFLSTFLAHIKQLKNQQYNDLISRNLFIEGETLDVWEKYSKKAKVQKATLFAVIGGKFSEGVNFSDELARCVIIVGLPYPNMLTPEFRAKTEYLRTHFSNNSEISSNLAMNICMTQVNQAIGRVVRHKLDYGIVVLLDSRYSDSRHSSLISKWAQPIASENESEKTGILKFGHFFEGNLAEPFIENEEELLEVSQHWIEQPLDHFNISRTKTWFQRYWNNSNFYDPNCFGQNCIIFLMIGGNSGVNEKWITNPNVTYLQWAKSLKAMVFLLEHRFYGESQPSENISDESLKYLSSKQALKDIANFIQKIKNENKDQFKNSKLITFGGSYGGTLSAWFREKFPEFSVGAVGSSGISF
uniref:ATP-dependent helicase C-terminal domain-containing protein n=1 Tax=Panagrolaimus sp. ES5 TaxID=591445 RepID=A0AC34FKJ4_9BILA